MDKHGHKRTDTSLIPQHGGYRNLKSFQIAEVIYDVTVRFCEKHVDRFSRTRDQMVQAARSGRQNIAEGSMASATSKKTELKLTNVAKASLEELKLDYEDFLRQRELPVLEPGHPALKRFKARRCATLRDVRLWVADEVKRTDTDQHGRTRHMSVSESPCLSVPTLVANAALSLLNLACYLLGRQLATQAESFGEQGGFTERLYRVRSQRRR
ncbi:MAG: four helix bundle suffix domain-containing protein [Verrucomicrobia bacterium]|nr:four helix bundle suffix domain-containing protein [Verrucomicrobiota bacterium]